MTGGQRTQGLICAAVLAGIVAAAPPLCAAEPGLTGEETYANSCIRCHGEAGAGTPDFPKQLAGDLSVAQLAALIEETMPEDDPGTLSAGEAKAVAAFIHDAFYSPIAQARNKPARIELARLTVRQYRHAIADLIGSFAGRAVWGDERGLRGEYFGSREPEGRDQAKLVRTDAGVEFDFGAEPPVVELEDPRKFSIRWQGSVLAPDTGTYEFIIRTNHAARLWVNGGREPLIDAWVKSGDDIDHAGSVTLVGGRPYALRLEFTKAKQGVDDSDKQKELPPPTSAAVALLWRRPNGAQEVIPARMLTPADAPEQFVSTTPFPPDDRSYGWERGTAVSQAWDEATTNAAIEAVTFIADRVDALAGTNKGAADRTARLRQWCLAFAERAFRAPLDVETQRNYVDEQFAVAEDADAAVRRSVLLVLKSPRFLFREPIAADDGVCRAFDVASRLAFGLWNSMPDEPLVKAAREGKLTTADKVRPQAQRMLADLRAKVKLQEFLLTWLHLDAGADLTKDSAAFPKFDAAAIADVRTSLELTLDEVLSSPAADYRRLLLDDEVYLNERLACLYDVELDDDGAKREFRKVRLDDGERAGVLTHPYVLARFAYASESSPIHRGVFLARGVLGRTLRPPPDAFVPLSPDLHPDLTTRERVTLQTKSAECMSCHAIINPLGFTLERFDAIGRFRATERGKPVDAATAYKTPAGETVELDGARALGEHLAASRDAHAAFVEQLFHHLVQQPVAAYRPGLLDGLVDSFERHEFNIRSLAEEIMVATALVGRETDAAYSKDQ
jgi:hypothetical protein